MNINTSKSMTACFKTIANNKIKAFEQSLIKNYGFENIYISRNPLVIKHLLIIAIEELNNRLKLKKKKLRVDFNKYTYWHFIRIDYNYFLDDDVACKEKLLYNKRKY